jgi:hypothetical protein
MNWLIGIIIILPALLFPLNVEARSGCCSHHGGVCGCNCCDGSGLSATCLPYYPNCSGGVPATQNYVIVTNTPRPTNTPTLIPTNTVTPTIKPSQIPTPIPTSSLIVNPSVKAITTETNHSFWSSLFSFFGKLFHN